MASNMSKLFPMEPKTASEGQLLGEVLNYLRTQTQLVIGQALEIGDLREFLKKNGVEP
jgi:2-succinyl-5-enolpyruvyl-6-hydroxy-3-cyclohexene-1-carboxylate synthase